MTQITQLNQLPVATDELTCQLMETTNACVKVLDLNARLTYFNPGGLEIMEIDDVEPLIGQNWLSFWNGDDRKSAEKAIRDAVAGRVGTFQGFCPTMKDSPRWWDVTIVRLTDATGQPYGLLAVSRDITAQREVQHQLVEQNRRLEKLNAELLAKQQSLQNAESMVDDLMRQAGMYR